MERTLRETPHVNWLDTPLTQFRLGKVDEQLQDVSTYFNDWVLGCRHQDRVEVPQVNVDVLEGARRIRASLFGGTAQHFEQDRLGELRDMVPA